MISFYYGTMASGKSTAALQLNFSLRQKNHKVLLIKPSIDTRDVGVVKSRIGIQHECYVWRQDEDLNIESDITHIIVDEAQFLSEYQIEQLCFFSDIDVSIYCFGLRTTYKGDLFEGSARLFAIADNLYELPTISYDGNKTIMHVRYQDGKPVFEGDKIHVGGDDMYLAVSRKEWRKLKSESVK